MKTRYTRGLMLLCGMFSISLLSGQDLRFYQQVQYNTPIAGQTTATFYVTNIGAVARTLTAFQLSYPFHTSDASLTSITMHPTVNLLTGGCCFIPFPPTVTLGSTSVGAPFTCDGVSTYDIKANGACLASVPLNLNPGASSPLVVMVYTNLSAGDGCLQSEADSPINEYSGSEGTGLDMIIIDPATIPLPVRITRFRATRDANTGNVKVNWQVASEINVNHYIVERSVDRLNWEVAGRVDATPESAPEKSYDMRDENIYHSRSAHNTFYYRLYAVDNDGSGRYSQIESVRFSNEIGDLVANIFPNPSTEDVTILFDYGENTAEVNELRIFNNLGQLVYSQEVPEGAGAVYLTHSTTGLIAGSYALHLLDRDSNTLAQQKLIVQR